MISQEFEFVREWKGYDIIKHYDENGVVEWIAFPIGAQVSEKASPQWARLRDWCTRNPNE
jgi:hypothetical protein